MKGLVIFDLDGTLANIDERRKHLLKTPRDWDAFNMNVGDDLPIQSIIDMTHTFATLGYRVAVCTARMEQLRDETERWLGKHNVMFHELHMRPNDDTRDDTVIKQEMLNRFRGGGVNPVLAFDDRPKVVRMWKINGIPVIDVGDGIEF